MKILGIIFLINIFPINMYYCQKRINIIGKDSKDKYIKTLGLITKLQDTYYSKSTIYDTVRLKNKEFKFKVTPFLDNFPRPFYFVLEIEKNKSYFYTKTFFISKDTRKIKFDSDTREILSKSKFELEDRKFDNLFKNIYNERRKLDSIIYFTNLKNNFNKNIKLEDSLKLDYQKIDSLENNNLINLSKIHSKSIILFWKLVERTEATGYNSIYSEIFKNFDPFIKNSKPGKIYKKNLEILKSTSIGQILDIKIYTNDINKFVYNNKYTLIDFWFSYCQPCIEQFPKYKEIYNTHHSKKFEIVGISTDRKQDKDNWLKVIKNKELNWQQFLDEDGVEAKKLNINKFPTNFLLDSEGKIIKKDISPEELEKFLEENLK